MFTKVSSTIAAFILSTSVLVASPQGRDMRYEGFKREMMPKVGKRITVIGVLQSGKLGWLVAFNEWVVNIRPVAGSDRRLSMRKMDYLNRFAGHAVEVTGTLRYFPEPPPTKSDRVVAIPPEHFYFDVAEAKVVSLISPRSKRSKGRRRGKTSLLRTPTYKSLNQSAIEVAFHRELVRVSVVSGAPG